MPTSGREINQHQGYCRAAQLALSQSLHRGPYRLGRSPGMAHHVFVSERGKPGETRKAATLAASALLNIRQGRELHDRLLKAIAAVEKAYR